MGNTCASVHIAWRGIADDAAKAISRCYSKLGYERVKKPPAEGGKHVVLLARNGQSYVSVYDSDNAQLDNGELKDLALACFQSDASAGSIHQPLRQRYLRIHRFLQRPSDRPA